MLDSNEPPPNIVNGNGLNQSIGQSGGNSQTQVISVNPNESVNTPSVVDNSYLSSHGMNNFGDHDGGSSGSLSQNSSTPISRGRSKVWNEFVVTGDGKKVTCRQCGDSLSYSHSHSTSSMLKHLKRKHNMDLYPAVSEDERPNSTPSSKASSSSKKSAKMKKLTTPPPTEAPPEIKPPEPSVQHDPLIFTDPCVKMRWADHSDNVLKTFSAMYNDEMYTDCILVAEKQFFKGHRMILSSFSEFLDEMFKITPQQTTPIIFLKDIKAMELRILLDFIYKGEVSIPPHMISNLVKVGSDLKVRGLSDFVWNDQLASNVFQKAPPNDTQNGPPETSHSTFESCNQTSVYGQDPFLPSKQVSTKLTPSKSPKPQITNTQVTSTSAVSYMGDKSIPATPSLSSSPQGVTKTYARLFSNVRPVNIAHNQPTNMACSLGDGTAIMNSGYGYKRIRIVTAHGNPAHSSSKSSAIYQDCSGLATSDCETVPETVLMMTNHGETVLSASQGVTFMAPSNSLSLPVNISMKDQQGNDLSGENTFVTSTGSVNHAIPLLSECGGTNQDLTEVVYHLEEVPGGSHEVLIPNQIDSESIVEYSSQGDINNGCDLQDKKLFAAEVQK